MPTDNASTPNAVSEAKPFPLKYPFTTADGSRITELSLRRARAKDLLAVETAAKQSGSETSVTLAFLASVNDLSADDIGELDAEDLVDIGEVLGDFLPEGLKSEPEA